MSLLKIQWRKLPVISLSLKIVCFVPCQYQIANFCCIQRACLYRRNQRHVKVKWNSKSKHTSSLSIIRQAQRLLEVIQKINLVHDLSKKVASYSQRPARSKTGEESSLIQKLDQSLLARPVCQSMDKNEHKSYPYFASKSISCIHFLWF